MRSTIRTSGREILNVLIHSAKAPASRVETTPTSAMLVDGLAGFGVQSLAGAGVGGEQRLVEGVHVADQRAHMGVDLGGETRAVSHLDEVDLLDADAVNQAGRFEADLHRLLGRFGDLVEPLLELADLGRLVGQVRGREARTACRPPATRVSKSCFDALRALSSWS